MEQETSNSDYTRALNLLTRYLAMRDHSRHELQMKMLKRFPMELVERLLSEADERGWLVPEDTIAERQALAWRRQMKSRRYIEGQLRKRKLPLPAPDDEQELENMRSLVTRKFGPPLALQFKEQIQAKRFLLYRGFAIHLIGRVFNASEF